jgi:predicted neuraminidase
MRLASWILLLAGLSDAQAEPGAEFVFEQASFPSCHASTILEAKNGDLLAAWFGGSREGADDVAIWLSRRSGDDWSAPLEMARHEQTPTWNPVLFRAADGTTFLFYKFGTSPREWTGAYRSSVDDGRTWSDSTTLPAGLLGPIRNKPLILPDGTIVSGASNESYQAWASWVEISRDDGRTWTRFGPISHPAEPFGIIQPAIVPVPGGLRMFVRARNVGRICSAESYDGGRTWSPAWETELPNPNSGIDAVGLADGRIVLVYNHTERGRTPLNVAVSADHGKTWNSFLALEDQPGEYSYPAVIQASNGDLLITYTWKRERIKHVRIPLADVPAR